MKPQTRSYILTVRLTPSEAKGLRREAKGKGRRLSDHCRRVLVRAAKGGQAVIEYCDFAAPNYRLGVSTGDTQSVRFYRDDTLQKLSEDDSPIACLDRDAVAALVGQLSSWLAREAKP